MLNQRVIKNINIAQILHSLPSDLNSSQTLYWSLQRLSTRVCDFFTTL
ncbi:hypothetical protein HMPREF9374_2397 [Desmospora sp. 8437]|nr:hypothetical protein HMPREF9374_2397 [Desmospora sp. 8437]